MNSWNPLRARRSSAAVAGILLALAASFTSSSAAESFPALEGSGGAVAAAEAAATEAGLEILRQGGNAVDAAVATALALVVVHPEAGNLGGGGFAVVKFDDQLASLDFRETAPAAATPDMFLDANGRPRPDASELGPLAAGVPGSPKGLWELHRRFGSVPWSDVVGPAHRLAESGFEITVRLHESLARKQEDLARFPETASIWLPAGQPPAPGTRLRIPALAETLKAYARHGPDALSTGDRAAAIERLSSKYGGIIQSSDLAAYEPRWRPVIRFEAFGWDFATMDLPASGGIILGQTLKQLEALGWRDLPRLGAQRAHLLAEVWRRAFADRFLMGDPSSTRADSGTLLGDDWLEWRRIGIRNQQVTPSSEVVTMPESPPSESRDTTHLSVVDDSGNMVSMTLTLNGLFGCKVLVPELGYFLNNEMDDFATAPGQPNTYGLIQGEANAIAAGKRMLSSMSPTLAWDRERALVVGARGGSMIPTATAQVVIDVVVDGEPLQAAINRPRLHHQWLPDTLEYEPDALSPETRMALENLGHRLTILDTTAKVNAVMILQNGRLAAAADPRGPATAGIVTPYP